MGVRGSSSAIRLATAAKALFACLLIGGPAVGYVFQKRQLDELGKQIHAGEVRLEAIRTQNKLDRANLAWLLLPQNLQQRLLSKGIRMEPARPEQVVRLNEPPAAGRAAVVANHTPGKAPSP